MTTTDQRNSTTVDTTIDFDKLGGLVPAVIQDASTSQVLMVGFMNDEALRATVKSGVVTFFSRTKARLWTKGETSGNGVAHYGGWWCHHNRRGPDAVAPGPRRSYWYGRLHRSARPGRVTTSVE